MRSRRKFWIAASLITLLLVSAVEAADLNQSLNELVAIDDQINAQLNQALRSSLSDAVGIGDQVSTSMLSPIRQALGEGISIGDQVQATIRVMVRTNLGEAVSIGDQVGTQIIAAITTNLGEPVSVVDQVVARVATTVGQSLSETTSIADQLQAYLLAASRQVLTETLGITDSESSNLMLAFRPMQTEALSVADRVSTTVLSVSGVAGSKVTTDTSGNTVITGTDVSGNTVLQVVLPMGTTGSSAGLTYSKSGANSMVQVAGVTVPYPPGKTVTILNSAGVHNICIVDATTGASLQTAVCGATDLSKSHVILSCDGAAHTFGPFPIAPASRTYTCAPTTLGGINYLQVTGLAFSTTIVDATPPKLVFPADISTVLTSASGAPVTFSISATDLLDPSPSLACSARSGSIFPIGTTTVNCTATDAAGNTASGSFHVSVVYRFGGFLPPLQDGGTYHLGRTIPVKFQLTDAEGNLVSFATATIAAGPVTGTFEFKGDHYQFNLDTSGMQPGPLRIVANLNDGTSYSLTINLTG